MKLSFLAAFVFLVQALPAQTLTELTKPEGSAAKPKPATTKKAAPAEAKKAKDNEVHTLAVMKIAFGGSEHDIVFELLESKAPKTVQNFVDNVDKGIYGGMAFHRAVDDYLVQTGDPSSKDDANREQWGLTQEYTIPGEFKLPHVLGAVAMARRSDKVNPERHSDGTQFYFVLGNMAQLNGSYTVFGQVVSGMEELKELSRVMTDSNDCPLERAEIKKIAVVQQAGPLVTFTKTGSDKKRGTRPDALKGPLEKFLDRVW
ncbi:MAG: peptidylprolyl isomerase [Roseimicrobium sp.]